MEEEKIKLNLKEAFEKSYPIRRAGGGFEVTVPKIVVEREMKRLGVDSKQKIELVWFFNDVKGLLAVLRPIRKKRKG